VVDNEVVDDVVVSLGRIGSCPAVDICAHGGIRVIERILETLERFGAPLCITAESPAPIWQVNNLIERETVDAMSRAKTHRAVRFLAWQREHMGRQLERAASLCQTDADRARKLLQAMLERYGCARTLIEGATLAILGPPNSGKSTLFNRLIGRSVTIVSPRPGTTRDWVTGSVEVDGVPLTLVDTAGRHETREDLEHQAIESGREVGERADVCLLLLDGSAPLSDTAQTLCRICGSRPRSLTVINKTDKTDLECVLDPAVVWVDDACRAGSTIHVSALTGTGLDRLMQEVLKTLGFGDWVDAAAAFFTARQRDLAAKVLSDLPQDAETANRTIRERLLNGD